MNKTYGFLAIAALAFTGLAATSHAADHQETFGSLTATDPDPAPVSANSTLAGGVFSDSFGGPNVTLTTDDGTDFPSATDDNYLQWDGSTDQYLTVTASPVLTNTATTVNIAVPIRVDTLAAAAADNTIDVLFVADDANGIFGLTADAGVFRMASSNDFDVVTLSNTAFGDAGATGAWDDGAWRILVGSVTPSTTGTGTANWYVLDVASGASTTLVEQTGITTLRDLATGVGQIGFGASLAAPAGTSTAVSVDDISIYDASLNTSALISAVRTDYGLPTPSSVSDWNLYDN